MDERLFTDDLLRRPEPSGLDVVTTLRHFAIITYAIDPERLRPHLHSRFVPNCVADAAGRPRALISVVPFLDLDFRFARCPWPTFSFGQTNYRAYVTDTKTDEHVVWFFGTCLDSLSVNIPHYAWKLPWHRGRIRFDCEYSTSDRRYLSYAMRTRSDWAPAAVELADIGQEVDHLQGFDNLEAGMVALTHPLRGYFYRRDGKLGSYSIWHDRLRPTVGSCTSARFDLLNALDLVPIDEQTRTHSVLIQNETEFTIYLPPRLVDDR